jgi:hypothetical protein
LGTRSLRSRHGTAEPALDPLVMPFQSTSCEIVAALT